MDKSLESTELDQEISKAEMDVRRSKKVQQHLISIDQKLLRKHKVLDELYERFLKEKGDVQLLEKLSLRALFVKFMGNMHTQLDIERQEYLHAYLQFESCRESIQALDYEKKILLQVLSQNFLAADKLSNLLKRKRISLLNSNSQEGIEIMAIESKIRSHRLRIEAINEVIRIGHNTLILLEKVIAQLNRVKSWGMQEYYGKSKNSSYKKKMYIRNAKKSIKATKRLMDKFEIEMDNVNKQHNIDYDSFINAFDDFIKIFYDALITDWVIQKKIKNATNALTNFRDKIDRILHMMNEEIRLTEGFITEEEISRNNLLIKDASR